MMALNLRATLRNSPACEGKQEGAGGSTGSSVSGVIWAPFFADGSLLQRANWWTVWRTPHLSVHEQLLT